GRRQAFEPTSALAILDFARAVAQRRRGRLRLPRFAAVDRDPRKPENSPGVVDPDRARRVRFDHDRGVNIKTDIAAVAYFAEVLFGLRVPGEVEGGGVVDRQHVTTFRGARGMGRRGLDDLLGGHVLVVKKPV